MIRERLLLFIINIFCPPVTVMAVAGIGADCLLNIILFLLGVLPGHIHGFYITCTYFSRKAKVRKGQYPGGPKMFIYSEKVWHGGASGRRVDELWEKREEERMERMERLERKGERRMGRKNRKGGGRRGEVVKIHSDTGAERTGSRSGRENGRVARSRTMV